MVTITVILAAVIGTFVMGMTDNVEQGPEAAVSVSGDTVQLQNLGSDTDGVAIVEDDGMVSATLTSTGATYETGASDARVMAYRGSVDATNTDSIDTQVDDVAVVRNL